MFHLLLLLLLLLFEFVGSWGAVSLAWRHRLRWHGAAGCRQPLALPFYFVGLRLPVSQPCWPPGKRAGEWHRAGLRSFTMCFPP
ncbi:MAG: hypothetical protein ACK5WR_16415 [Planctomycetaceae bacterium]